MCTAVASPHVAAQELPFIEVAPDWTTALRCRETGTPFVAVGLNYFGPHVGWAPKLWQQFDAGEVRKHLTLARDQGFNVIRVFLTLESFHQRPGEVSAEGVAKFRELLDICRELGIRVIPSGPDHWEGIPAWLKDKDPYADEDVLRANEQWWEAFTTLFRDDPIILAWDLLNEPSIRWTSPAMQPKWNQWLQQKYGSLEKLAAAHQRTPQQLGAMGEIAAPEALPAADDPQLYDYQLFRESIADAWTRRLVAAVRHGDPRHLVTIGHIQWASTVYLPGVQHYAAFNLRDNARHVDFVTIHFYPIAPPKPGDSPEGIDVNAHYLENLLRDCSVGKPVMIGEFAWYGGGDIQNNGRVIMPARSQEDQVAWCERLLHVSRGRVCGWLNWAFADTPTSRDLTRWSGLWTEELELKPWGEAYGAFAREATARPEVARPFPPASHDTENVRRAALTSPLPHPAPIAEK
ncbi:MAG: cellulase family glycosylhydrolase [Pirellulaceae bacterium]